MMYNLVLLWAFVIVAVLQQSVTLKDERSCSLIQNARFELLCGGVYNIDLFLKYRDSLTSVNAPYKVFYQIQDGFYSLLVCFNDSPVQRCNSTIQMSADLELFCGDSESPLRLPDSQIFCHRNIWSYVDDLLYECTTPRIANFRVCECEGEAAIHYASKSELGAPKHGSAAGRQASWTLLACLPIVLLSNVI
ncbi:uncharacterized protein LOC108088758 [Drosophila ficusphila]|uniref:uncharacterized protein LOC108088758 n=1 Tax=Drosophila ficusphila TaxID=30025 RepID=UPI0007E6B0E7|nr:uncharacterized protein LOC108088758 [Drosophila ficusphila]